MTGLDTNVVVRYLTQDDAAQASRVNTLFETVLTSHTPGVITLVTLVEVVWVLESCYAQPRTAIAEVIQALLSTRNLLVENASAAFLALRAFSEGSGDFSDALIVVTARQLGCDSVVSFDKKAQSVGMTML